MEEEIGQICISHFTRGCVTLFSRQMLSGCKEGRENVLRRAVLWGMLGSRR